MARNPSDRFESAADLAVELDRWCESVDPTAARDGASRDFVPPPHVPISLPEPAEPRKLSARHA
jgi:hypothetical protein